ncbi:MAG: hypothetical protein ACJ71W_17530 [Terriglobales bacterium]
MGAKGKTDGNLWTLIIPGLLYAAAGLVWWCFVRNAENWLAIAVAEVIACLSGIAFAWWLIRFLRVTEKEEETQPPLPLRGKAPGPNFVPTGSKPPKKTPPSWRLFANRAVEIEAGIQSLEDHSRKQRAIRAAKAQAAEEAVLARDRRTEAVNEIARAAEPLARNVTQYLIWQPVGAPGLSKEAATSAVQSAQQQFAERGKPWGEAHEEHFREILGQVDERFESVPAPVELRKTFVEQAKMGKQSSQPSDAERAAARLARDIEKRLGGNGG